MKFVKKLKLDKVAYNGIFTVFIDNNEKYVYKEVNYETPWGKWLGRRIGKVEEFKIYKELITNTEKYPYRNFTLSGFDVKRNGSYKCKYINGYILQTDIITKKQIENKEKLNIIKALEDFKLFYIKYNNRLRGDWMLHNLIYCIDDAKIYNVDLEGFYTWKRHWMHISEINYLIKFFKKKNL